MAKAFLDHLAQAFETPLTNSVLIFAIILFIILLSPILLRKIRIPGIIGLILSGVVIGPHGLNILAQSSAVDLFSTIGLLYIMFIAGLELDMNEFEKTKHKSITFGFFTFAIPLLVGYPICHYFLGYSVNSSLLIASMFSTHTLVAYPIVNSYGIAKNEAVAITTGGTILTDTAVLIILAIIVGAYQG
jgi:Kef-type K+ transport system membrane component KefB